MVEVDPMIGIEDDLAVDAHALAVDPTAGFATRA
jgi:hypothetical protein